MKRLIVVADDVGLHPGINAGVIRAHRDGIVTGASIVACGAAFAQAVELLKASPGLAVGVHLALVEEQPLSSFSKIPSLVGNGQRFAPNFIAFSTRWFSGRVKRDEVERELRAQIERVLATGLAVRHLNGHQHLQVLPGLFDMVLRLAEEYRIGWVRVPYDPAISHAAPARRISLSILAGLALRARSLARARRQRSAGRVAGLALAGHHDVDSLTRIIRSAEGETELVVHPGEGNETIASTYDWGYDWDGEAAALCDPRVKRSIDLAGVELAPPI